MKYFVGWLKRILKESYLRILRYIVIVFLERFLCKLSLFRRLATNNAKAQVSDVFDNLVVKRC